MYRQLQEVLQGSNSVDELFVRWISVLREKAHQYEHPQRKAGKEGKIVYPDLDTICNEMIAFLHGIEAGKK